MAALLPLVERVVEIGVEGGGVPAVDLGQVAAGALGVTLDGGRADVRCLVAGGTERDDPHERLHVSVIVVVPKLVAFNGVLGAALAADLAAVAGLLLAVPAEAIPVLRRQLRAQV